jgi:hypothetical protein
VRATDAVAAFGPIAAVIWPDTSALAGTEPLSFAFANPFTEAVLAVERLLAGSKY